MLAPEGRPVAISAGLNLRNSRERLGLTMRDVEAASLRIAQRHGSDEFALSPSRLSDIETKGVVPSLYRLYSLCIICRLDLREVLSWYGIDLNLAVTDLSLTLPPKSHLSEFAQGSSAVQMPLRMDPAFDLRRSTNLSRMIEQWGLVPLAYLAQFVGDAYVYGYIGSEDFTMHPLLPPGTFLQVDESRNKVTQKMWRSEYERPVYFVETRDGYVCCWCALKADQIILQPHPLSPVPVRVMRHPQDAEVIGQVVGVALRLGDWRPVETVADARPDLKERSALN